MIAAALVKVLCPVACSAYRPAIKICMQLLAPHDVTDTSADGCFLVVLHEGGRSTRISTAKQMVMTDHGDTVILAPLLAMSRVRKTVYLLFAPSDNLS